MREIEQSLARVAEAIRANDNVPEDVLIGLEQLRGAIGRWLSTNGQSLYVPSHVRWFVSPSGTHVDLAKRPTMQKIMTVLVEARAERPGASVPSSVLVAAGWPGTQGEPGKEERVSEASANRLRVTLCRLRQLGLDAILVTTSTGWMLDPAIPLVREPEVGAPAAPEQPPQPDVVVEAGGATEDGSGIYINRDVLAGATAIPLAG
jgi:hypothetical protein